MKLSTKITKFQQGGAAPGGAPAQGQDPSQGDPSQGGAPGGDPSAQGGDPSQGGAGGQDPVTQLVQMAQEALQSQNCQSAMSVCDGLLQILSQGQQGGAGGGQPGGGSPAAEQGAPVYKRGGKMLRRV